jgi:hypothetical protein
MSYIRDTFVTQWLRGFLKRSSAETLFLKNGVPPGKQERVLNSGP